MSIKVYIHQTPETFEPNTGIGRVVHAQYKYLPKLGIELVRDYSRAEILTSHTDIYSLPRLDVCYCHGIYWTGDPQSGTYNSSHYETNQKIISAIRKSLYVTVPSQWVAEPFRRDMRISPIVIPHGIDSEKWIPSQTTGNYILWNKNRGGDVCDPTPAWELARRGYRVLTTFAPNGKEILDTLGVMGQLPADEMQEKVQNAYLYLATTKETFGIGTLEALSCGVPVVGFDWGGTRDIITNGVDGVLVTPYDYDALHRAVNYAHEHRREMSEAAREKAKRYTWSRACEMYAEVYARARDGVAEEHKNDGVAIVVTSYNYGQYLPQALSSLLVQTEKPREVIVVDDASSDNTTEIAHEFTERFESEHIVYTVITHPKNQGVAAARNHGVATASARFITCLDADDRLHPLYVAACHHAFTSDRGVGIAYTGLGLIREDGRVTESAWPGQFSWEAQAEHRVPPATCIPTASMFRRTMWERSGGYRQKYAPGEDAEFYTRGLSLGFTAVKVTESPLIEYRNHGAGAHSTRQYIAIDDDKPWMRDRMYPLGAPAERPPLVRSYSNPLVAIYVTGMILSDSMRDTLDSIVGQTWREWEVIVDADDIMVRFPAYPFIRRERSAPLCIRISAGQVLPSDYLTGEILEYISHGNREWDGGSTMGSCCGGRFDASQLARIAMAKQGDMVPLDMPVPVASVTAATTRSEHVRMEYTGKYVGAITFFGKGGRVYRAGNNALERYVNVHRDDVELMAGKGFNLVALPKEETPVVQFTPSQPAQPPLPTLEAELISPPVRPAPEPRVARVPLPVQREDNPAIPEKFQKIVVPSDVLGDLAGEKPIAVEEEPIQVSVKHGEEEDDATYDARVKAAMEAERKRRANESRAGH